MIIIAALLGLLSVPPTAVDPTIAGPEVQPPSRFQGDAPVLVLFVEPRLPDIVCQPPGGHTPPGYQILACTRGTGGEMILPNPCDIVKRIAPARDPYAELVCHELGHENGWPGDHPKE